MDSIVYKILNQEEKAQELRKQNVIVLHDFKFDTNKQMIAETLKTIYKKESKNDWESTNINIISFHVLLMLWSSFNNTR